MTFFLFALTFCLSSTVYSEWDPSYLHQHHSAIHSKLFSKKYDQLKKQVTKELKNSWCSEEKINLIMDLILLSTPKTCVEVGVHRGASLLPIAATLKYLNGGVVFCVDAWSNMESVRHLKDDDLNKKWWSSVDMNDIYRSFKQLITKWSLKPFCIEIHKSSDQAIDEIPQEIDFLHLDGDYSEIGALQDVELYLPKVKKGGYILLSNLYIMVQREQPKIKAFCALSEHCTIVATIENDNAVLFQKE